MDQIELAPLTFTPYLKEVLWGGNKLHTYKQLDTDPSLKIGESWEISAVPGHETIVNNGQYSGLKLSELTKRFGISLLGSASVEKFGLKFPLLLKFIDAADDLSIQVHPNDSLADWRHNSLGKTELWYIISAEEEARIYAGLNKRLSIDEYEQKVMDGSFAESVKIHESQQGDVFILPPGRVHAIGKGNLLAEIQESSDITYRIFDYNRRDSSGNLRELHTKFAKDAIDLDDIDCAKKPTTNIAGCDIGLAKCHHFTVRRLKIDGEYRLNIDKNSFTTIMCLEGNVTLNGIWGDFMLAHGHSALLPAGLDCLTVSGNFCALITQI